MRNILKQSSYLFLAQLLIRFISFLYVIFLARTLGVESFGLYTIALAYFSIFSSVSDLGFNRFLIREVSKDKNKASELLSNILMLRVTFTVVLFAVFSLLLYTFDPDSIRVSLILLATAAIIPQAVVFTFDAVFAAFQKLQFSAVALFLHSLVIVILGFYLISKGFGAYGAVTALVAGQVFYSILMFAFLFKKNLIRLSSVKYKIFKETLKGSLPYGLLAVLGLLYFRIDAILLSYLKGSFETGLYGAAYKFLESIIFVPAVFSTALFPAMVRLHENKGELKRLYYKSLKLMFLAGVLLAVFYMFALPILILSFLPNYIQSINAVKILSLAIPFIFLATPGVQLLFSTDKFLKSVIFLSFFTLIFNIAMNLILIPNYGFIAAAWVTVFSEILSFAVFYLLILNKRILEK